MFTWRVLLFWRPRLWLAARRGRRAGVINPDHINARCTLHPVDPEPFGVLHGVHDYPPPVLQWDDLAQAYRTIYLAEIPPPPHVWNFYGLITDDSTFTADNVNCSEIPPPHVWLGDDDKLI